MVRRGPTNPELAGLIGRLQETGRARKAMIWLDVAEKLSRPSRRRCEVNVSDIERYAKALGKSGATKFIIAGKVLSSGVISGKVNVAALSFSKRAREKILSAGGTCQSLAEAMDENPEGSGLTIMG